jgi:SAM-dependent methyltransferase
VSGPARVPALGPAYARTAPLPGLTAKQLAVRAAILAADAPTDYETVPCPCGSPRPDIVLSDVDRHGLPARNVVCEACGLVRLTPRWKEGRYLRFYEAEYRSLYETSGLSRDAYARSVAESPATRARRGWIEAVWRRRALARPARLVEIGAGGGWNLLGLPSSWERVGYDVDDAYLAVGRDGFGLDLRHGLLADALPALGAADLVLLSHVLEHLPDPSASLRAIANAVAPGALVLIEVPGIFRIHRTNLDPRSYLQNAHTFTYCATTLRDTCWRAGLDVIEADETARAVCMVRTASIGAAPVPDRLPLVRGMVRYLRACDFGFRQYLRLASLPTIGRAAGFLWRRTYFWGVGRFTLPDR